MGIPLEECKQEYVYMRKQFKAPLFEKMLQYGNEFGLVNLTCAPAAPFPALR